MNFAARLKTLRSEQDLTQIELALKLNISKSSVGMYESGKRIPEVETFEAIADYFNVNMDFLQGKTDVRSYAELCQSTINIPILGRVAVGVPIEASQDIKGYIEITGALAKKGRYFALEIKGDSMAPYFLPEDVIIVREQRVIETNEISVVVVNGQEATVKKIKKHDAGVTLIPINPAHNPIVYTKEECEKLPVEFIGKVVELRRTISGFEAPHQKTC